jgi:multidrug efflux pump subunit AcrA (membrane-fusion protein)
MDMQASKEKLLWMYETMLEIRDYEETIANVVLVKTNQAIVAPVDGRIEKILVRSGETFAQGKPIALLKEST